MMEKITDLICIHRLWTKEIMNGDAGLDLTDRELIEAVLEEEPNKYILYFDECEDAFILIEIKD